MRVTFKGMSFQQLKNGMYKVSVDKWSAVFESFSKANEWIYLMAPNNDLCWEFQHRICAKFNCDIYGDPVSNEALEKLVSTPLK